ncbi:MAG TPA: DUF2510 domain-containing protein [Mycobacterium sp.]|nr:DUF2510 domain-containing protein [Mycobacterium sp.]
MSQATQPGWYQDPSGANAKRYFDGINWTDKVMPFDPASASSSLPAPGWQADRHAPEAPLPWRWVIMAAGGPVAALIAFVLMQLAFSAAQNGSGALFFEIVGFTLFLIWLASIAAMLFGVIAIIVWGVKRH